MSTETLPALFEQVCARTPARTALDLGNEQITYAQLAQRVDAWRAEMSALGLGPQERVLVAVGDRLDFIAAWFGLWRMGCIPIPIEASAGAAELARAVAESQAHCLIAGEPIPLELAGRIAAH